MHYVCYTTCTLHPILQVDMTRFISKHHVKGKNKEKKMSISREHYGCTHGQFSGREGLGKTQTKTAHLNGGWILLCLFPTL